MAECKHCQQRSEKFERLERHNRILGFGLLELVAQLDALAESGNRFRLVEPWARKQADEARKILARVHYDK
jgi:cytochrome c553